MNMNLYHGNQVVVKGHGFLTDVIISDSVKDGYVSVYDGANDNGKLLCRLYIGDSLNASFSPRTFPVFSTGLYLKVSSDSINVNIGYRESI